MDIRVKVGLELKKLVIKLNLMDKKSIKINMDIIKLKRKMKNN